MTDNEQTSATLVEIAAAAASDKKAQHIVIMDMQKALPVTDYFLIGRGGVAAPAQGGLPRGALGFAGLRSIRGTPLRERGTPVL